jgi:hypothetical protein
MLWILRVFSLCRNYCSVCAVNAPNDTRNIMLLIKSKRIAFLTIMKKP